GTIAVSILDERRQEFLAAQASLEGAKAAEARASLDLEYSRITAPIAGRIDRKQVSAGNLVQADQTILTSIVSLDPIDFYFDVDERTYLSYAQDAQTRGDALQEGSGGLDVFVRVDARGAEPVAGKLDFAENRIDSESGTLRIRARFPNDDLLLQPGLFGRINVPGSLPYRGVLVPDEAVASDQGRRIVYVVDAEGLVSAQQVQPGPRLHGYRVIRNGLSGDETIVVNGLMRVRPGVTIDPQMTELPPSREEEG
ncbi:MAG: efflux RND transporter periplasmic adaptor subunit, partial [Pseudomonadota bacterium]